MMEDMPPLEEYLRDFGDTDDTRETYYRTYLIQTDYIAYKIAECLYLGTPVDEKYKSVLLTRAEYRAAIEALKNKNKEGSA